MIHIFQKGQNDKVFVLLHGTGGNEFDLIQLARYIDPNAARLGIRGNISEHGMNRFFKRLAVGIFDEQSIEEESIILYKFILEASEKYQFELDQVIVLGFSNGANIVQGILSRYDQAFKHMILLSPVLLEPTKNFKDIKDANVFISSSREDPYATFEDLKLLEDKFKSSKVNLDFYWHSFGHTINVDILEAVKKFYQKNVLKI